MRGSWTGLLNERDSSERDFWMRDLFDRTILKKTPLIREFWLGSSDSGALTQESLERHTTAGMRDSHVRDRAVCQSVGSLSTGWSPVIAFNLHSIISNGLKLWRVKTLKLSVWFVHLQVIEEKNGFLKIHYRLDSSSLIVALWVNLCDSHTNRISKFDFCVESFRLAIRLELQCSAGSRL